MDYVYCAIKFPAPRNYERIRVDVNLLDNSATLREKVQNEILQNNNQDFSLIFCGNELEDDKPINNYGVNVGSTIQVLKKAPEPQPREFGKFTELDVSRVCSLFKSLNSGNFHKISRPEVIQQILEKYPEIQKENIMALSFLKDPILLSNLQNPETVRNLGENHRILVEAAETICKALRTTKTATVEPQLPTRRSFEDLSDSSSSSSSENAPQPSTSNATATRITQDYLRRSLEAARQDRNSLANISQRNLSQSESTGISPSSSTSSVQRRNVISNSMVMSAIDEVLRARRSEMATQREPSVSSQESASEPPPQEPNERMDEDDMSERDARDIEMITSFQTQLKQMEDMGLTNKAANIQALMVCNGNLEAAVNLVLAEMNMS